MSQKYNYTFIIPHKNRQDLLVRCLDSIPNREDVQIIIVDDNSDPKLVDFKNFPGLHEKNTEVYFTKKGKGAGYARNVGLDHAKGKWVVFADSDDWYLDNLEAEMDAYADSDVDMVVFRQKRVSLNGDEVESVYDAMFDDAVETGNIDKLKRSYFCPIGRFIKKELIDKYQIKFQEVRYSNDVLFSLKVSYLFHHILLVDRAVYCVCESENSLLRNKNWQNPYIRTKVGLTAYTFLKSQGLISSENETLDDWKYWLQWWYVTKSVNFLAALFLIPSIYRVIGNKFIYYLFNHKI